MNESQNPTSLELGTSMFVLKEGGTIRANALYQINKYSGSCFFVFVFFPWLYPQHVKFPGQGTNPYHSPNQIHSSASARCLTAWATNELLRNLFLSWRYSIKTTMILPPSLPLLSCQILFTGSHNISETLAPSSGNKLSWHPFKVVSIYSASPGHLLFFLDPVFATCRDYSLGTLLLHQAMHLSLAFLSPKKGIWCASLFLILAVSHWPFFFH